ncbi:MAG TPA: hypothetical protein VMN60_02110 [Longimicrobiales bacterium]|nr:hypothetical protein [Longimicrobiales bacterium]
MRARVRRAALCLLALGAGDASAQRAEPGVRGMLPPPALSQPAFRFEPIDAIFRSYPFSSWVAEWSAATQRELDAAPRALLHQLRFTPEYERGARAQARAAGDTTGSAGDSIVFLPPLPPARPRPADAAGVLGEHADIGLRVQGVGNLGGNWTQHKPCDPAAQFSCNPGLFPQLKPDVQFGVRVAGTVSDRVHVDVDYDQTREFDAANNINVYYQGLADEVLQRLDVGDVSIRLPATRYMTRGIPSGNFGFAATAQLGPLDTIQILFAQQKGDITTKEFKLAGGARSGLEQDAQLVLDDADYVKGQFFFLIPPAELLGYPHVDALALRSTDAPASVRPGVGGTIQLYRDERLSAHSPANQVGYFLADALPPGGGLRHTGSFRRLVPQQDYIVHASGLWVMLRSPLRPDEALAAAFITETGDTVGRMNAETAPPGTGRPLRLLRGPTATHQPGSGTWPLEMHQVYRLDSSSAVDLATVDMRISLGELAGGRTFRDVLGQQLSFLRLFGLDEDAPIDRVDAAQVYQPARSSFTGGGSGSPIGGTYIVFPTLRPFFEPAPVASVRMSAADVQAALGRDANAAIYEDPDPVTRAASSRFRLNFSYRVRVEGLVTSFNLGAFGIREGSERLFLGGRLLQRDIDYTIEYEIGTVTLLDAPTLFATAPNAEIRATWEQKPLFNIAPTSVFGARARYSIGPFGELNFVGLYQAEKSLMARPQLGAEPGAGFVGGASGRLNLGGALLDRMLGALPNLRSTRASALTLAGELAFSMPDPNRRGTAYLDDFEASDEVGLSVRRQDWKLGSAPQAATGDRATLPFIRDASTALPLVWQHDFLQDGAIRGALAPRSHIDRQINIIGNELPEPVMWLTFGSTGSVLAPAPGEARRWRSMTTVLSTTGRDMTRSEYLEFYVSAGSAEPLSLTFDIGVVSEDAFHVDSLGRTSGTDDDGRRWGLGELDEEARLIAREVWGTDKDQRGLWNQTCRAEPLTTYPLGDPRANCTRGNGINDTEDLNGNGVLDRDDGQYFRYVVQLDQASEFLVRDTAATGTGYRLYRLPLRHGVPVNGANEATWRFIRHLRMTVAGEPQSVRLLSIARMRIVGSRWTKRDVHGVQRGLLAAGPGASAGSAEVRVGPVSSLTDGARYSPPPGVLEQLQDPTQQFGVGGTEINEKSLRLAYDGLGAGDRAEIYYRYPQQPRDMRTYSELRVWVLPRAGSWGPDGAERFTLRIGSDPNNYYLFQTKLQPATGARSATFADWLPEIVIDFQRWLELKAAAEHAVNERGSTLAGADTVWSADSTYAIVLEDRARAPSLAAVRELVFAVYNGGGAPTTGEIWIDELRIGVPDRAAGRAANISVDLVAGDLIDGSIVLSNQAARFRQLGELPTYVGGTDVQARADTRLDKLLPASWGVDLPLSISHSRTAEAPAYLQQTDVIADRLPGLRETGTAATRIGVRLSKRSPTAHPLLSLLLDGPALRLSYVTGDSRSVTTHATANAFVGDVSYLRNLAPRSFDIVPAPLETALRALAPAAIERSDFFNRLIGARLRWSPQSVAFGSAYSDQMTRTRRFDRILATPSDSAVRPIESPRQGLRNDVTLGMQPFTPLIATLTLTSDRDLLDAMRASTLPLEQRALQNARSSLGGMDIGWELARALTSTLSYSPQLSSWLRVDYGYNNRFITERNPSYLQLAVEQGDTLSEMQRSFESTRQVTKGVQLQPRVLASALDSADGANRRTRALLRRVQVLDLRWNSALSSQFERQQFTPAVPYQLGLGSYDAFRVMGADTATRAQTRTDFRAGVGFTLIGDASLSVAYSTTDVAAFDQRGGTRRQHDVGWPSATLMWRDVPLPATVSRVIVSLSGSAGVERTAREETYTGALAQRRAVTDYRYPVSLQVGLARGFTIAYRGSFSGGETLDPTGNSEKGGHQHDLTMSAFVRPPARWNRLTAPVTVYLQFTEQDQQQCRYNPILAAADGCVAYLDVGTRNANLKFETEVSDITVGSSFSYVSRENQVGTRAGSSQFQFQLYGRFNFSAGRMPEGIY